METLWTPYLVFTFTVCILSAVSALVYLVQKRNRRSVRKDLTSELMKHPLQHLGIIMDGNRRWARANGHKPWIGHRQGIEPVKTAIEFCLHYGIKHLSLYVFSLENFQRPPEELDFLFNVLTRGIPSKKFEELYQSGVRVRFVGDRSKFPPQLVNTILEVETKTATHDKLNLNLLFCYGGQQEIVAGVKRLCDELVQQGETSEAITEERLEGCLWSSGIPSADLIIRTGKVARLSNFLLFKAAYSEFYFLDCFWPEVTERHLVDAVRHYVICKRNFGK